MLATRLDELLDRKRKLEEELEEVLGSILSTDQKLNETRRELSAVNRNAAGRSGQGSALWGDERERGRWRWK